VFILSNDCSTCFGYLNQRYWEHIHYIRNNAPQSAYAQHILQNLHEYRSITDTMSLLKSIHKTSMLFPYDRLFIQTFHHNGNLITEQGTGEQTTLFQLAIDAMLTSATTWKQKQINTPPTTQSNQFQPLHDSNRQQYGYVHHALFYSTYCIFRRIYIIDNNCNFNLIYRYSLTVKI
jgi:hypothetical protein